MQRFLLILSLICISVSISFSQLSKEEAKKWKKEMKMVGPAGYKKMSEQNTELILENRKLTTDVADLEKSAQIYSKKIAQTNTTNDSLSLALNALTDGVENSEGSDNSAYTNNLDDDNNMSEEVAVSSSPIKGTLFKVQIGAYKEFDLSEYFNNHKNFGGEIDDDGTMKYTLGQFKSYSDAETFKKLMVEMGVKGAWIVAYKDNIRTSIHEALNPNSNSY